MLVTGVVMLLSLIVLLLFALPRLALADCDEAKEDNSKNNKTTIQGDEIVPNISDNNGKSTPPALRERMGNISQSTSLDIAATKTNTNEMITFLQRGADINRKPSLSETPQQVACWKVTEPTLNFHNTLSRNGSVDVKDLSDTNLLRVGESAKSINVANTIFNLGTNVNAQSNNSTTPSMLDAGESNHIIENVLFSRKTSLVLQSYINKNLIHLAVMSRNLNMIKTLLHDGVNVNAKDDEGMTPLMRAALDGDEPILNLLLSRNASLKIMDEIDNSAVHHAVVKGNLHILKVLLKHGGDVDGKGNFGMTPLMLAAQNGDEDVLNLLISRNASLEIRNNINDTVIHVAAKSTKYDIIKRLIDEGTNVNSKGANGNTPIILVLMKRLKSAESIEPRNTNLAPATFHNDKKGCEDENEILAAVKTLVESGADVNSINMINRTALHEAAATGYTTVVDYLLFNNARFDIKDNICFTPLLWAANNSNIDVIKTLLNYGDDVNGKGCNNVTALHIAAERNDSNLLNFLLSQSADTNVMREDGRTPLDVAFQRSRNHFIKPLLDHGSKVEDKSFLGSKALFVAVANKSVELVRLLLDRAVELGSYPTVILNYAIGTNFSEGVQLLILNGANIEKKDIHGNIPLSSAIMSKSKDLVKLILETGAKKISKKNMKTFLEANSNVKIFSTIYNVTEIHRVSPIHIASYLGLTEAASLLILYGASLEIGDERRYTPLHYAIENGHIEVVKFLLDNGADKNSADINRMTPLHVACRTGVLGVVKILLSTPSADVDPHDNGGYTPLHYAAMNGSQDSQEIVKILLDHNADKDAENNYLTTPLHLASLEGHVEIVKILLNAGANREATDIDDNTPLHLAARERYAEIVKLILKAKGFSSTSNKNGSSPLHLACGSFNTKRRPNSKDNELDTVKEFKDNLIYVNDKDNDLMSVLHVASRDGSTDCVKEFLFGPLAINIFADRWRNYPLHYAALNGHIEIARLMLMKDTDGRRNINAKYETPLILASREGHADVVALLLQGGVDDFRPDINGRTALHRSAARGHFEVVKLLLSSMAKRDAEDKWGFSALNYAASWRGYQDVIGYLSTSQLNVTLSYYFDISDPFQRSSAKITNFFV